VSASFDADRAGFRTAAAARALQLGLPHRGDEAWKYTSTAPLIEGAYAPPTADTSRPSAPERHIKDLVADRVFVNGASVGGADGTAVSLSDEPAHAGWAALGTLARFDRIERDEGGGLIALNAARATDAALVSVPAGDRIDTPVYLQFHTSARAHLLVSPRIVVTVGRGASLTLVEHHTGVGPCWNNAVTEIVLEDGASLKLVRIQEQDAGSHHTGATFARLGRDATLETHDFACGARLSRSDVRVRLAGPGASVNLRGLCLADGERHTDQHTVVFHDAPHTHSLELYKGILLDDARGVFTGRILVEPGVRGCTTRQENPNLLLSEAARIFTRPQLEIRNNDVKAYHGATVGRLSPEALFYLRSRGLDLEHARRVLTAAFAAEIVDAVPSEAVRDHLRRWLDHALGGSVAIP